MKNLLEIYPKSRDVLRLGDIKNIVLLNRVGYRIKKTVENRRILISLSFDEVLLFLGAM